MNETDYDPRYEEFLAHQAALVALGPCPASGTQHDFTDIGLRRAECEDCHAILEWGESLPS